MEIELADLRHVASVAHEGKVVVAAVGAGQGPERIVYSVRNDGIETAAQTNARGQAASDLDWAPWAPVPFAGVGDGAIADVSVIADEAARFDVGGTQLLSSVYDIATTIGDGAISMLSSGGHVHLLRLGADRFVHVDRFVLDGRTNRLLPTLELRYRRSEQRLAPAVATGFRFDSLSTTNATRSRVR